MKTKTAAEQLADRIIRTHLAADVDAGLITAEEAAGICDRTGCKRQAVKYVLLFAGAVHLCRKHAKEIAEAG